jgi:hypothetical protein
MLNDWKGLKMKIDFSKTAEEIKISIFPYRTKNCLQMYVFVKNFIFIITNHFSFTWREQNWIQASLCTKQRDRRSETDIHFSYTLIKQKFKRFSEPLTTLEAIILEINEDNTVATDHDRWLQCCLH